MDRLPSLCTATAEPSVKSHHRQFPVKRNTMRLRLDWALTLMADNRGLCGCSWLAALAAVWVSPNARSRSQNGRPSARDVPCRRGGRILHTSRRAFERLAVGGEPAAPAARGGAWWTAAASVREGRNPHR